MVGVGSLLAGCTTTPKGPPPEIGKKIAKAGELLKQDSPEAVREVVEMVSQEESEIAKAVVWNLGQGGGDRAMAVLGQVAVNDKRAPVRQEAAMALCQRRNPVGADVLRQMAQSDTSPQVRAEAAAGLGRVGSPGDVDMLVQLAETASEEDRIVQSRAVGAAERLIGLRIDYDPKAPSAERAKALARLRMAAAAAVPHLQSKPGSRPQP
jgi:HEAT repeat protein